MTLKTQRRLRKKLFVDSEVQGALLRRLLVHWGCATAIGFCALLLIQVFSAGFQKPVNEHLAMMWEEYGMMFVVLMLAVPALAYDSIKLSHRFAGPMFAIRTSLTKLAAGEKIQQISFREGDFWSDIANSINKIAEQMDVKNVLEEGPQDVQS